MMNDKILAFFRKQTAASICCMNEMNDPYSFSCFFAFNSTENLLYYKSSPTAYHSLVLLQNPKVSGTIMPDKLNKLAIKGIQFTGVLLDQNEPLCMDATKNYYSTHPLAVVIPGQVWTIQLRQVKMTDNVPGFPKKYVWEREKTGTLQPV